MPDDDQQPEDRPQDIPAQQSAVDPKEDKKRESRKKLEARQDAEFIQRMLADPAGRRFIWGLLNDSGAFKEKYGFGPYGHPNTDANQFFAGQRDFGQRLYHTLGRRDPAGMLSLVCEFDPRYQD